MNQKNVTIKDIALKANVSKSTVSRVLNNTTPVNKTKRQAVLSAMEELKFKPNVFARRLAGGKSMTIGIVTEYIGSPFYDSIAKGAIEQLNDANYTAIIADGQWQEKLERDAITTLVERQVDGLIIIGGSLKTQSVEELIGDTPSVMVARRDAGCEDRCVYIDNKEAAKVATNHLIEMGHKKIAHIMGDPTHRDAVDRYAGYKEAMAEAGLDASDDLFAQGDFEAVSGESAMETLLEKGTDVTAVFAANDQMALGARLTLFRKGIRCPEDMSIIGFDNQISSAYMTPPMTTVAQPGLEMGRAAAELLLDFINKKTPQIPSFSAKLVIRESVAKAK